MQGVGDEGDSGGGGFGDPCLPLPLIFTPGLTHLRFACPGGMNEIDWDRYE